jgi:hypothetical protein
MQQVKNMLMVEIGEVGLSHREDTFRGISVRLARAWGQHGNGAGVLDPRTGLCC